jgi:hypothetical protein
MQIERRDESVECSGQDTRNRGRIRRCCCRIASCGGNRRMPECDATILRIVSPGLFALEGRVRGSRGFRRTVDAVCFAHTALRTNTIFL